MTQIDIAHQRLFNQYLLQPTLSTAQDVASWLGAVQAQDYAAAKWAVGMRMEKANEIDIEQAFNRGSLLRTHLLRPTWHFVTPADIRWLLTLTAPRVHAVNGTMYRQLELDETVFAQCYRVLVKELQDGQQLTRDELREKLRLAGIATDNLLRVTYIMMWAELERIICSGPRRGKQFTYMLLEERVPPAGPLTRDEALAELSRRYFLSRGPATVADFARWSGLTIADARHGLDAVKNLLVEEVIEGRSYWLPPTAPITPAAAPQAYLLSVYDEYVSGYKDRSAIGEAEVGPKLIALGNALAYIIVVDGQIVGTFRRVLQKKGVTIEANLFRALTEAEDEAMVAAAHRFADFINLPLTQLLRGSATGMPG